MSQASQQEDLGTRASAPSEGRGLSSARPVALDAGVAYGGHGTGHGYGMADDPSPILSPLRRGLSPRDVLIQAFYNKRLIRNCLIGGLVLGLGVATLTRTQYTADSLLLVLPTPDGATAQDLAGVGAVSAPVDGLKMVQSEVQIIRSEDVARHAVEAAGPATLFPKVAQRRLLGLLPPAAPEQQEASAIRTLNSNLRVDNEAGTNVVRISYTGPDRQQAIKVVKSLVDSYLDRRRTLYASDSTSFLSSEITHYADQLKGVEGQIQDVRNRFGVLDITQDVALATNRLDSVLQRESQVRERRTAVHAEMLAAQQRISSVPQQVFDSREVTNNSANDDSRNTLLRLQQEREHMASQYSANWPALKELDTKIASVQSRIGESTKANFFTARSVRNPVVDQLGSRLASLQVEDQSLDKQLGELTTQYQQALQRVADLRNAESQLHDLQRQREVAENIYRQLSMRQAGSQVRDTVVDSRNSSLRMVQPASAPLIGRSMALTYLLASLMLGAMIAVAASLIATMLRQVYIMPSEAERDLDLPSLAEFNVEGSDFASREGRQQVGNLAAFLLDISVDGRNLSVVQVVSATDSDGKAELVRALALELAQGHGLRTLILDLHGDGRAEATALGGADKRQSLLQTEMPVVATDVPQLWVSVDAARSTLGNARTLVARSRELIEGLRQHFDMVLIISPPDITDYASRRLSALVDANLLVVRSEHTRAPVATQMRDVILSAGGNLLGFAYTWRRFHIPASIYRWL